MTLLILALCIVLALAPMAQANSAPTHWEGTTAAGLHVDFQECPIVVEHETLTFDLGIFPREYYEDESAFTDYWANVTAEYTFRNPTDADVTMKLLFPFGIVPQYAPTGRMLPWRYEITLDGEPVSAELRHSLVWGSEFILTEDSERLHDGFMEHRFYSPDMSVTRFTFRPKDVSLDSGDWLEARVRLDSDPARTKYILEPANSLRTEGDHVMAGSSIREGETAVLYVIGEVPDGELSWELYVKNEPVEGTMECVAAEQTTLQEFLLSERPEGSEVSETDWYNALVQLLDRIECSFGYLDIYNYMELMNWYEYEVTVPAGGTVVNTVTAPMYPDINNGWEPAIYSYDYLLSPARGWAEFGTLDIEIKTPYYMTQCNLDGFEKTDDGYSLHLEGLPDRELAFVLSADEHPARPGTYPIQTGWIIAGLAALIVAGVMRRKRKT